MNNMNSETHSHTKTYLAVFGALAALTLATVGVSYLHLARHLAIAVGLMIAAIKVTLIVTFFMHLKDEKKHIHLVLYTAFFFVMDLLILVLLDIG